MIPVLITWIWIFICAYLWGYAAMRIIHKLLKTEQIMLSLDVIIVSGIGVLAVYAELYSIFSGVGLVANLILLIIDIFVFVKWKPDLVLSVKKVLSNKYNTLYLILVLVIAYIAMTFMFEVVTYDTGLYHSQAVQWIDEYGVVKGLGNLHHRFAYNSALMCLQALFSMRFMFGQQLHCVNGFMYIFFTCYAIGSMKIIKYRKVYVSDFIRLVILLYYNMDNTYSSLGSDLISLCLVIYLVIKFIEGIEDGISNYEYYAYLSLLAVIAISFKLSVAAIVLIAIYPAYLLIKDKKWLEIIKLVMLGTVLILPFLVRNVIISGYLVYPFPGIDIFNVDWKMNKYVCLWDAKEIKSWAQGICDAKQSPTFGEWFEIWMNRLNSIQKYLFYASIISSVMLVVASVTSVFKDRDLKKPVISLTIMGMLVYWFVGAPHLRYGVVFMIIPVFTLVGTVLMFVNTHYNKMVILGGMILVVVIVFELKTPVNHAKGFRLSNDIVFNQVGFEPFEYTKEEFEGLDMYIPENGDRIGNRAFPSTPYIANLSRIELLGDEISDGFRVKDEYKDACFNTYGGFIEPDIFK